MVVLFSCGALPVVLVVVCFVFFFSCSTKAGAPGRHERVWSPRCDGGTAVVQQVVHGCLFFCNALPVVFLFLFLCILQHRRKATRKENDSEE